MTYEIKGKNEKQLRDDYKERDNQVKEILDRRGDDDFTAEEMQTLDRAEKEMAEIEDAVSQFSNAKGARERAAQRKEFLSNPVHRPHQGSLGGQSEQNERAGRKSMGQSFVNAENVANYLKGIKSPDGNIAGDTRVQSPPVAVPSMMKSLITGTSDTSAGALVTPDRQAGIIADPFRVLTLRDLVTIATTLSDLVEYVRQDSRTNNAAAVGEAVATGDGSGEAPESAMTFDVEQTNVKGIKHWIPVTKRALSDAGQVASLIDTFLNHGLQDKLERLCLTGNGTGENILGILNTPNIGEQAFATDRITTIRKARTQAKKNQVEPNAIMMNAQTWESFDLDKDGEGRFYFGGPTQLGNPRLWGLPVIENEALADNQAIVADWRYATLYDREAGSISMTDSHKDFFTKELVAVMATLRAAFAVLYPKAFIDTALAAA